MMFPVNTLGSAGAVPAERNSTPGWRDPRMWIGIAIVAVSVVGGVRLIGAADESVSVWSVADDVGAGTTLDPDQLSARRVRFVESADAERYLRTDETLPAELFLTRPVGAGELLPRAALGSADDQAIVEVPIGVSGDAVPPSVETGTRIDLYIARDDTGAGKPARLLLEDVVVVAAPGVDDGLGSGETRQLVLGVPQSDVETLPGVIGATAGGAVTVVARR